MKIVFAIFLLAPALFVSGSAFPKAAVTDAYARCMARTKHDRLNCQAGCGMIIYQCYGEGLADINNRIAKINDSINAKNESACKDLAVSYLNEASQMEANTGKQAENMAGWVVNELSLSFARQRLENVLLIQKSCQL